MKITKSFLNKIIMEELDRVIEGTDEGTPSYRPGKKRGNEIDYEKGKVGGKVVQEDDYKRDTDDDWIDDVDKDIKRRDTKGKCTPITKPGCTGRAKALAKTFKKMGRERKAKDHPGKRDY